VTQTVNFYCSVYVKNICIYCVRSEDDYLE